MSAKSLIIALLPAFILTGCALDKNTETGFEKEGAKSLVSDEGKVSFDWYINYSWFNTKWGDNAVSKAITDKTGVDINFISPLGNEEEKLNSLIASGSLPDLITLGWWEPQVN